MCHYSITSVLCKPRIRGNRTFAERKCFLLLGGNENSTEHESSNS